MVPGTSIHISYYYRYWCCLCGLMFSPAFLHSDPYLASFKNRLDSVISLCIMLSCLYCLGDKAPHPELIPASSAVILTRRVNHTWVCGTARSILHAHLSFPWDSNKLWVDREVGRVGGCPLRGSVILRTFVPYLAILLLLDQTHLVLPWHCAVSVL